uniref:Uncharacterized protein n=1 Tax=Anguilla anguilla TaxID=7936 RepID=A0A0E9UXB3_ANGAN
MNTPGFTHLGLVLIQNRVSGGFPVILRLGIAFLFAHIRPSF